MECAVQLKMSEKSLFAVLLRSPWWISFVLTVAVGAACYNLFPARFAVVGALSGLPFAVIGSMALWRQMRLPNPAKIEATLESLAAMSGRDFATAIESAYRGADYKAAVYAKDGADLKIEKDGRVSLVCCKRWKAAAHGVEALRDLAAAMTAEDANLGIYVALNPLSAAAQQFASKNSIRVLQGTELALLMKDAAAAK
jgi:restriction system protein